MESVSQEFDGAQISIGGARTRILENGVGRAAWIALIAGPDPMYRFRRKFCRKQAGPPPSGQAGFMEFKVVEEGMYEFRLFCKGSDPQNISWSGFTLVLENGAREISLETASRLMDEAISSGEPLLSVIRNYVAQSEVPADRAQAGELALRARRRVGMF
jgi:hypothetical protein